MQTFFRGALALAIFTSCGAAAGASAADAQPARSATARAHDSITARVARVLDLQPGDENRMAGVEAVRFEAVPGDREFTGELIVRAKEGSKAAASARVAPLTAVKSAFVEEYVVRVPDGLSEGELAAALMATGDYEFAAPNWRVFPLANPNDPQYGQSWQHARIQSALAWDITQGSPDVIVAVCDSGVKSNHADLAAALVPGYNSANRRAQVDGGLVEDINGHGTFVAGCAAAIGNNGVGVVGVGWNLRIMPIRVTNSADGSASLFALTDGARWAAANGARVVNVSFTGATASGNNNAARDVKNSGGLLFWASGNDGVQGVNGNLPDLVIVGSTTSGDGRSGFSNYGSALGVVAPGSSVRSTRISGGYGNGSGTSYASPIAAGVGAMIFSANPDLSPDDVQDVLFLSSDDLGAPGWDQFYGHGRVNTFNAVTIAQTYLPRLGLPIFESFDSSSWNDLLDAAGTAGLQADPDAPSGGSALALTGDSSVQTVPLAGRQAINAGYSVRLAVRTEGAEAGESLAVEYLDNTGSWETVFTAPASGADTGFVVHEEMVPNGFLWHGVQLRVTTNGSDASDRWIIDDLSVDDASVQGAPFAETFDVGRVSPMRWQAADGVAPALLGTDFVMEMPGGSTANTVPVPIVDLVAFEQWATLFVGGDGVGSDDTLSVQYATGNGAWQNLGSVNGGQLGAGMTGFEFALPFGVVASSDFRLRLVSNTGGGAFFVDDVTIGTDRLPDTQPGCSIADLAEPFDTLNFFDLSAYLSLYNAQDPDADLAAPFGVFNFFDLSEYLSIYNAGCP